MFPTYGIGCKFVSIFDLLKNFPNLMVCVVFKGFGLIFGHSINKDNRKWHMWQEVERHMLFVFVRLVDNIDGSLQM